MITNRTAQLVTSNLRLIASAKKNLFRQKLALIDTVPYPERYRYRTGPYTVSHTVFLKSGDRLPGGVRYPPMLHLLRYPDKLKRGRPQQRKQEERKISYITYLPYRYRTFIPRLKRAAAAEKKEFSENCDKVVLHLKTLL